MIAASHRLVFASRCVFVIAAMAAIALAGCGGGRIVYPAGELPPVCVVVPHPLEHVDTVRVAIFDAPRPERAPAASNAGERLLFGQLYETLITVDCLGEVRPGLAHTDRRHFRSAPEAVGYCIITHRFVTACHMVSSDYSLLRGYMGKHTDAGHITGGINMGHGSTEEFVDFDSGTVAFQVNTAALQVKALDIRPSSQSDKTCRGSQDFVGR